MNDDDIKVGAVVRPIRPGRADLIGRILGVHGDDAWILPLDDDPTLHSFVMARDALRAEWERYEEPDVTNWAGVYVDEFGKIDAGAGHFVMTPHEALVLAAWLLRIVPHGRKWGDIQAAVDKAYEGGAGVDLLA